MVSVSPAVAYIVAWRRAAHSGESRGALDTAATGHKTYGGSHVEGTGGGGAAAGAGKHLAQQNCACNQHDARVKETIYIIGF